MPLLNTQRLHYLLDDEQNLSLRFKKKPEHLEKNSPACGVVVHSYTREESSRNTDTYQNFRKIELKTRTETERSKLLSINPARNFNRGLFSKLNRFQSGLQYLVEQ